MDQPSAFLTVPITKSEPQADGSVVVYGKCTGDDLDLDEQIIDKDFARDGLEKWLGSWANIRQMHSTGLPPAGKGVELDERDDGFYLRSRIVEPGAVKLVNEGVYGAYSVGISQPRIIRDAVAKNGRVIGGVFSEVSLVDFPANPTTKFVVAKMATTDDGEVAVDFVQKVVAPEASTPQVTVEDPTPDEIAKYGDPDAAKTAKAGLAPDKDTDGDGEKSHAFQQGDDGKCKVCGSGKGAAVHNDGGEASQSKDAEPDTTKTKWTADKRREAYDKGHAMAPKEDGGLPRFPIEDRSDVEDAVGLARTPEERAHVKRQAKRLGAEDAIPDSWKIASPFALKRLHDACCPAYGWDDVYEEYPTLGKDGPSVDLAKQAMELVRQMLLNEVNELADEPAEIWDVMNLTSLYQGLCSFAQAEDLDAVLALEAHATLHKAFKDANPNAPTTGYPKPGVVTSAGKWRRPRLDAGQYRENASGPPSHPAVSMNLADAPSPSEFTRGYLSAGHAREGKAAEPDVTKLDGTAPSGSTADEAEGENRQRARNARTYYTNSAKQQAVSALRQIHDHLTALNPELCVMDHDVPERGEAETFDTSGSAPAPVATDQPAAQSHALAAGAEPTLVKGVDLPDFNQIVSDAVTKAVAPLQARIAELEAAPDPAKAPFRGTVVTSRSVDSQLTKAESKAAGSGTEPADDEELKFLERIANTGNPESRERALAVLAKRRKA